MIVTAPLLLALFTLIFAISPLNGEDFGLSRLDIGQPLLERLSWIVPRAAHQWLYWNARLGEQLSILWLSLPPPVFEVVTCFAFVLFFWLIATLARGTAAVDATAITGWSLSAIVVALLWPRFEYFFWRTAVASYLHPMVITLLVVVVVTVENVNRRFYSSFGLYCVAVFLAFLAGISFENLPPVIICYVAAWHYLGIPAEHRRQRLARDAGVCAALLAGWIVLVAAPSTGHRKEVYAKMFAIEPGLAHEIDRVVDVVQKFFGSSWPLFLASVAALALLVRIEGARRNRDILVLGAAAILCVGSVVAAPYTEPRAFGFAWIVMAIPCVRLLARYATNLVYAFAGAGAIAVLAYAFQAYLDFRMKVEERDSMIRLISENLPASMGFLSAEFAATPVSAFSTIGKSGCCPLSIKYPATTAARWSGKTQNEHRKSPVDFAPETRMPSATGRASR